MSAPDAYKRKVRFEVSDASSYDNLMPLRVTCLVCRNVSVPAANMTEANEYKGRHRDEHWFRNDSRPHPLGG